MRCRPLPDGARITRLGGREEITLWVRKRGIAVLRIGDRRDKEEQPREEDRFGLEHASRTPGSVSPRRKLSRMSGLARTVVAWHAVCRERPVQKAMALERSPRRL